MKIKSGNGQRGAVLLIVMIILVAFTLFVSALLQLGRMNAAEIARQVQQAQAFWLAEAGVARCVADLYENGTGDIPETELELSRGTGIFRTEEINLAADPPYAVIAGVVTVGDLSVTNLIRITLSFADQSYKEAVSGLNQIGDPWTFSLSGSGQPVSSGGSDPNSTSYRERGGSDSVYGDIYVGPGGSLYMSGESSINPAINPNTYGFDGSAFIAPGGDITVADDASISGQQYLNVPVRDGPDLYGMNYPANSTHNITEIFNSYGITYGRLPSDHPLYNLVRRAGDNYYFEPTGSHTIERLTVGDDRVYYVDGDVWFDKNGPLQFDIDGTATIVASGNIHISDSLQYVDRSSNGDLLALVALGSYDPFGNRLSGGNIYFGDARYGTLYEMDAFMFAANNFYYNFYSADNTPGEPHTGFEVFGNFVALNQILVYRDWYGTYDDPHPAVYDTSANVWKDALTGIELTADQKNGYTYQDFYYNRRGQKIYVDVEVPGLRHYRMTVKYDERINNPLTQPPGLPANSSAGLGIFQGVIKWQQVVGLE